LHARGSAWPFIGDVRHVAKQQGARGNRTRARRSGRWPADDTGGVRRNKTCVGDTRGCGLQGGSGRGTSGRAASGCTAGGVRMPRRVGAPRRRSTLALERDVAVVVWQSSVLISFSPV
jgi:hypothetical protein